MKKLLLFGSALILLHSCSEESLDSSSPQIDKNTVEAFGKISVDGTSYVLNYIQNNIPSNGRISQEETTQLIISATDEYLKIEGISEEERQSTIVFIEDILTSGKQFFYDGDVTEMQASFIAALELIFQQEVDIVEMISMIENLEAQALTLLTEEEIGLILMATSTAKSQTLFWYDNLNNSADNARVMCVSSWRDIGNQAVAGAMAGASACGVARFFGPIGWKAWAVCVVGGAVGAGVEQCLAPNKAALDNCKRYSGGNIAACGGFLNYKSLRFGVNPYQLLNQPIVNFP
jgi:hypothetical protein